MRAQRGDSEHYEILYSLLLQLGQSKRGKCLSLLYSPEGLNFVACYYFFLFCGYFKLLESLTKGSKAVISVLLELCLGALSNVFLLLSWYRILVELYEG